MLETFWDPACEVAEEGVKRCQSDIPSDRLVSPVLLEMIEESQDEIGVHVIEVKGFDRSLSVPDHETEQRGKRISVAADGMGAKASHGGQVLGEKMPQRKGESGRVGMRHDRALGLAGPSS